MKIGIWLDNDFEVTAGGGFSYKDLLIKSIESYSFDKRIEVCFVGFDLSEQKLNKETIFLKFKNNPKIIYWRILRKFVRWIPPFKKKISTLINDYFRKELISNNVKLIFYPIQSQRIIEDFPFIATYWDIAHLSMPAFPEVYMNKFFETRQKWFQEDLKKAFCIFAETNAGKVEVQKYLSIDEERIKILPIFPGTVVNLKVSEHEQETLLKKLGVQKGKYFFYPAQFWAHKNHFNLIEAMGILLDEYPDVKLILSGSDKGNLPYIQRHTAQKKISESIIFPGFVSNEEIFALYKNAIALVMPTFLGPSNMPILEAMALDCPVLCSDLIGHRELVNDAAMYFDPSDKNSIHKTMKSILDPSIRNGFISKLQLEKKGTDFTIDKALQAFEKNMIELIPIRECWDN